MRSLPKSIAVVLLPLLLPTSARAEGCEVLESIGTGPSLSLTQGTPDNGAYRFCLFDGRKEWKACSGSEWLKRANIDQIQKERSPSCTMSVAPMSIPFPDAIRSKVIESFRKLLKNPALMAAINANPKRGREKDALPFAGYLYLPNSDNHDTLDAEKVGKIIANLENAKTTFELDTGDSGRFGLVIPTIENEIIQTAGGKLKLPICGGTKLSPIYQNWLDRGVHGVRSWNDCAGKRKGDPRAMVEISCASFHGAADIVNALRASGFSDVRCGPKPTDEEKTTKALSKPGDTDFGTVKTRTVPVGKDGNDAI